VILVICKIRWTSDYSGAGYTVLGGSLETSLNIGSNLDKNPILQTSHSVSRVSPTLRMDNATLSNWAGDAPTSKTVWEQTTGATRSWITCGPALNGSTLIELPCGTGEIIATQMRVEEKLAVDCCAAFIGKYDQTGRQLFPPTKTVGVFSPDSSELPKFVADLNASRKLSIH